MINDAYEIALLSVSLCICLYLYISLYIRLTFKDVLEIILLSVCPL
jgi:hypothetical protein